MRSLTATDAHLQTTEASEMALASAVLLEPGWLDSFPEFNPREMRHEFPAMVVATALRMHHDGQSVDLYRVDGALDRGGALAERCGRDCRSCPQ